jgi:hypothetical protein
MPKLIDPVVEVLDGDDTNLLVKKQTQHIPSDFLDKTAEARLASSSPSRDFHKFASIPVSVVEKWRREGFDILKHKHSAKEIMARLNREDLGHFITTSKVL